MTNTSILSRFGLNRNDILIYDTLLHLGRSKTGPIIKETGVASSRVYASLLNLVNRGLVSYQVRNNIKYYKAELPDQLIEEAGRDTEELKALSKTLADFPISHIDRNEINTYEGVHGFKMAFAQNTQALEPKEVICVIAFNGSEYIRSQELRLFFKNTIDPMMAKKKCIGKMIMGKKLYQIIKKERTNMSIYKVRHLPSNYVIPYTLNISNREVLLSVWGDKPIVFSIKNPIVVASFKKNFDFLWSMAKK